MKYSVVVALRAVNEQQLASIALQMAEKHPATFEKLLIEAVPSAVQKLTFDVPGTAGGKVFLTPGEVNELNVFGAGQKVSCIKRIRELTGLGLKEAKDLCEASFQKSCSGTTRF